ncbi:MAG TPA: histidine--tRNA ligase [Candidatus Avamphibacillus intestinigallinarum]|nr:histidine--tRNA ligase [Candidatus Avamphibacillus intestinigallinarum]
MSIKAPRGTEDLLPGQVEIWQYAESVIKDVVKHFNYKEIRTPIFEHTELFQRGVGDSTDIVQKEMYTFKDRGDRSITLRPEGTAAVVRAYVENKMYGLPTQPVKLFYFAEMFRYERPQHGRTRQFHQFGVEVLGSNQPAIDAEVINLAMTCYEKLGLKSLKLVLNSLGDQESRTNYRKALIEHFTPYKNELCHDCQSRLEQNPLRILDCKKDREHQAMQTAPSILDYLNESSRTYFEDVKHYLDLMEIPYVVDANLVRGLDYYNHTAFEIMSEADGFGAITTLAGGGRYNGLAEDVGGPETPGMGFAMGFERLIMALQVEGVQLPLLDAIDCYVVSFGEAANESAIRLTNTLRQNGISADQDYEGRKMKAQMKSASRNHAKYVCIIGESEVEEKTVMVKAMDTGEQESVREQDILTYLRKRLNGGIGNE